MSNLKRLLLLGCSHLDDLHRYFRKKKFKLYIIDFVKNKRNIYFCDLKNKKKCLYYAKKFKISNILTDQNDFSLESYGHIVDKLKLPGISKKITKKFIDKYICRKSLYQQKDLRSFLPSFYNLQDINLKKIKIHKEGFILKPRRSQGSRDINYFKNKKELNTFLKKNIIKKKEYILEEYIPGKDIGVEGFVINKRFTLLGVSFKKKFNNSFVDQKITYSSLPSKIQQELEKISTNIIKTLKLDMGLFHAEFRKTKNNKLFIIEAACRGAGSYITSNILKIISNFDYKSFLYSLCLDRSFSFKKKNMKQAAILAWYKFKDKKIKKIDLKKTRKLNFLNLIKLSKDYKNKNLHFVKNSTHRKLLYIIKGASDKELRSNEKKLIKNIKVVYH